MNDLVLTLRQKLVLGPRPKLKKIGAPETTHGATCIVTLLHENEGAKQIATATKKAGLTWLWFPMAGGNPDKLSAETFAQQTAEFGRLLAGDSSDKYYVHCAAGIHRTGMFAFGALLQAGCGQSDALSIIEDCRGTTAEGVGEHRLDWVAEVVQGS